MTAERARLAAIVESSDDAIVGKTLDGIVVSWNRGAERIFGYTADEMVGQPIARLVPQDRRGDLQLILDAVGRGERIDHFETERIRKDGRRVYVSLTVSPIRDGTGRIVGASKIARDVTFRKQHEAEREELLRIAERARAEAERADRTKDQFLAMLAHELRNPLGALRNALVIARRDDGERDRALDIAQRQADNLRRLIDDLLDVARFTSGQVALQRATVLVATVVERALETAGPAIEEKGHAVAVSVDPELAVDGDVARLEQMLENLLSNASKYTPPGGHIRVVAERHGDEAVITVTDDGVGLAPAMVPHVFDPFTQAERGLDRREGGLGIGLTVVRRVAELHGGRVAARSEGLGRGASFEVHLPALPVSTGTGAASVAAAPAADAAGEGASILVIEDNVDAAESLRMLLELHGHRVRVAPDGEIGIAMAERDVPDLMLVDIGLPKLDGYEIAALLRRHPTLRGVLLAALTGYGCEEDRERALAAGFDRHLVKPADADEIDALARHARGRRVASAPDAAM